MQTLNLITMKKIFTSFIVMVAMTLSSYAQPDILQRIQSSPDHTIFANAIEAAGVENLYSGSGPITAFAPTDDAFNALPDGYLDYLLVEPNGLLRQILFYHLIPGSVTTANFNLAGPTNSVLTDQTISFSTDGSTFMVNMSNITQANVNCGNGRLHVIDAVLIPSLDNVLDIIADSDVHNTLEAAVLAAGLDDDLTDSPALTVFAPTDDAFAALPENLVNALLTQPDGLLADILLNHVVGSIALSENLTDGQEIETLFGENVVVDINGGITINGATVTTEDIRTINGVVHIIDAVLVPSNVPTVLDIVEESEDHTILETAVIEAELNDDLQNGTALTVFAPTDAAFELLPENLVDALLLDPTGILANILLQHVVESIETSDDLAEGEVLSTLLGQEVTISNDGTISVDGAVVSVENIPAINGIVHVIDAVLIPEDQTTVYDVIVDSPDHNSLESAIDAAELNDDLQDGDALTVFAPTDDAFDLLPEEFVDALFLDPTGVLAEILLYHVAGGIELSENFTNGQTITTLFGEDAVVGLNGNITIDGANVSVEDIPTINGVVHVIDAVLAPEGASTVLDIVVNSPDHTILEEAVIAAGLDTDLSDGEALTVFAPTDAAFDALPENLVSALLIEPDGVLANILLQHVVETTEYSADLNDMDVLTSLLGQELTVTADGNGISINGATVTIADRVAINGVVHVIDAVIIPENQNTVYDVISNSVDHTTLLTAVDAAGLDFDLQNGAAFTVFAPTNEAFEALSPNLVNALLTDPTGVLTEVLQYHVVESIAISEGLTEGQTIGTLFGEDVIVGTEGGITINGAIVTVADIPTINGVVHIIDAVLIPDGASTIVDIVVNSEIHTTLEQAVIDAGLVNALSGEAGDLTLFAPTDEAFDLVDPEELDAILADPAGLLADVLLYHAIPGIVLESDVITGDVPTLFEEDISIDASSGVVINGNATVTVTDLVGINGVVHVINAVLIPTTLNVEDIAAVESFSVFPNPANSVMNVELEMVSSERISIDFVNMLGQVVRSVDLGQRSTGLNREVIDIQDLADGFYLMNVTIGDNQLTHKFQVVR